MKFLLDTAPFLWMIFGEKTKFSRKALTYLEAEDSELYISAVSTWEISIKSALGKLILAPHVDRWLPEFILKMGLHQLPVSIRHSLLVSTLPALHRDPFDRLLIAQAKAESLILLTPDRVIKKYGISLAW